MVLKCNRYRNGDGDGDVDGALKSVQKFAKCNSHPSRAEDKLKSAHNNRPQMMQNRNGISPRLSSFHFARPARQLPQIDLNNGTRRSRITRLLILPASWSTMCSQCTVIAGSALLHARACKLLFIMFFKLSS